ncbi:hypothetical protein ACHHYP_06320 [Achlya hypogyna]|uniref:Uncharacterized protein n=1 Tax=Achlya hypogyna TaxID=1202772 RepID=A0A1V9YUA9_ACHHY|nr:hypothetical protein ACHHYP_06320 [Achlya hypogyna]
MSWLDTPFLIINVIQHVALLADVIALLRALPATNIGPALSALERLTTAMNLDGPEAGSCYGDGTVPCNHHQPICSLWPTLVLDNIPTDHRVLAVAALPVFRVVRISASDRLNLEGWTGFELPPDVALSISNASLLQPFLALIRRWHHRIGAAGIVLVNNDRRFRDEMCVGLAACPHLAHVSVTGIEQYGHPTVEHFAETVAAFVRACPNLRSLDVQTPQGSEPVDVQYALVPWLQSGRASALYLVEAALSDAGNFAIAVAASRLERLTLHWTTDILDAIGSDSAISQLRYLTALVVRGLFDGTDIAGVVSKLSPSAFTTLQLSQGQECDVSAAVDALSRLHALQEISLRTVWISREPHMLSTASCPALRKLQLAYLDVSDAAMATIVRWASTAKRLQSLELVHCSVGANTVAVVTQALPQWMARGLECLNLSHNKLDDVAVAVLAAAVRLGYNKYPLTVDLSTNRLTKTGVECLVNALEGCAKVVVKVGTNHFDEAAWQRMATEAIARSVVLHNSRVISAPLTRTHHS